MYLTWVVPKNLQKFKFLNTPSENVIIGGWGWGRGGLEQIVNGITLMFLCMFHFPIVVASTLTTGLLLQLNLQKLFLKLVP